MTVKIVTDEGLYGLGDATLNGREMAVVAYLEETLGKLLEKYDLLFLEDPAIAENQDSHEVIRQHTTTPLAIGETSNTIWDCKDLIQNQLIDYIRMPAT